MWHRNFLLFEKFALKCVNKASENCFVSRKDSNLLFDQQRKFAHLVTFFLPLFAPTAFVFTTMANSVILVEKTSDLDKDEKFMVKNSLWRRIAYGEG